MEPMRPAVDATVLELGQSQPLSPDDFILRDDGVCRLNPQLARMVAGTVGKRAEAGACVEGLIGHIRESDGDRASARGARGSRTR